MPGEHTNERPVIQTYCFFDTETTGLPSPGNNPRITELSLVALGREELLTRGQPRVVHKLTLCFNPRKRINPYASQITGLNNDQLEMMPGFDKQADLVVQFLHNLPQPVCLLAHNGNRFDFPLLNAELKRSQTDIPSVYCADTLHAFRNFDSLPSEWNKTGDVTPQGQKIIPHNANLDRHEKKNNASRQQRGGGLEGGSLASEETLLEAAGGWEKTEETPRRSSQSSQSSHHASQPGGTAAASGGARPQKRKDFRRRLFPGDADDDADVSRSSGRSPDAATAGTDLTDSDSELLAIEADGVNITTVSSGSADAPTRSPQGVNPPSQLPESSSSSSCSTPVPNGNVTSTSTPKKKTASTTDISVSVSVGQASSKSPETPLKTPSSNTDNINNNTAGSPRTPGRPESSPAETPVDSLKTPAKVETPVDSLKTPAKVETPATPAKLSYSLEKVYHRAFGQAPQVSHTAEDDCMTMLKIVKLQAKRFTSWCDENCVSLDELKPMY